MSEEMYLFVHRCEQRLQRLEKLADDKARYLHNQRTEGKKESFLERLEIEVQILYAACDSLVRTIALSKRLHAELESDRGRLEQLRRDIAKYG